MNPTIYIKPLLLNCLTKTGISKIFYPLMKRRAIIFNLHRFQDPERQVSGQDPKRLHQTLSYLRKHKFELISIPELIKRLAEGEPPLKRVIAFTMDDGYLEQATIAAPIFAEFDCPVTIFLSSGFLDRKIWFWWDQIEYIFNHTKREIFSITFDNKTRKYLLSNNKARTTALWDCTESCKQVSEEHKKEVIHRLAAINEIELPKSPPREYQPLSWELVRQWEKRGVTFGPHTITHPILSKTSNYQSHKEIEGSWVRLCEEINNPIPVFCYPNGGPHDYGEREFDTLHQLNFKGAVLGQSGHVEQTTYHKEKNSKFKIKRLIFPTKQCDLVQDISGIYRLRQMLRMKS